MKKTTAIATLLMLFALTLTAFAADPNTTAGKPTTAAQAQIEKNTNPLTAADIANKSQGCSTSATKITVNKLKGANPLTQFAFAPPAFKCYPTVDAHPNCSYICVDDQGPYCMYTPGPRP